MSWIRQGTRIAVAGALVCVAVAGFGFESAHRHKGADVAVKSISLSPNTITTGESSTATVTLTDVAPAGGTVVNLDKDWSDVTVPASVTVPEGQKTATFKVATAKSADPGIATLSANAGEVMKSAQLHLLPYIVRAGFSMGFTVNTRLQNSVYISLSAVPKEDLTVTVSTDYRLAFPTQTVVVPAGVKDYTARVEMGRATTPVYAYAYFTVAGDTYMISLRFV